MTATPEPEHTGVRPLSPYGGIEPHERGIDQYGARKECKGSYSRPPKITPYASQKAAFRVRVVRERCPECEDEVPVVATAGDPFFARHYRASRLLCPGSGSPTRRSRA